MDSLALGVSSLVHRAEELKFPMVRSKTFALAVAVGIPVVVLLHDLSDHWVPTAWNIPILSWFKRKWRQNPSEKASHLAMARYAIVFAFVAMALGEGNFYQTPMDYVADRVTSTTSRKVLSEEIQKSRRASFRAAGELVGEEELNEANVQQQRDAALRRRFVQESRAAN